MTGAFFYCNTPQGSTSTTSHVQEPPITDLPEESAMDSDHNEGPNSTLYQQLMALQPLYPTASLRELISFADDLFPYASEADLISLQEQGLMGQDDGYNTGNHRITSGLREDTIIQQLKIRRRSHDDHEVADDDGGFEEICVVCQAEYEDEEMLGALGCGHEYHVDCIRRWLLQRNFCPVCKRKAIQELEPQDESISLDE